jgi:hypothetical protein
MQASNRIVTKPKNDTVVIEESNGQRYVWKMPNKSWHTFVFQNIQFEVRVTMTAYGTPLIRVRDVEHDRLILQEPVRPLI